MVTERIKAHFEAAAERFDTVIQTLIPNYNAMIDALVSVIPFAKDHAFSVIDLGCGTGTVSRAIKDHFPNAAITCVDIAGKMLEIAKNKVGGDVHCIQADFNRFDFPQAYDLAVSSLALHHLETDEAKFAFYQKIHAALHPGGMFINADIVLGSDEHLQKIYMAKWEAFMLKNLPAQEDLEKCLSDYYAEDRPAELMTHLHMLRKIGFSAVDVIYKHWNYAVYCGKAGGDPA